MLAYARLDSYYLIDLQNRLAPELEEKGLLELAKEDFQHLAHLGPAPTESQPPVWWRLVNGKELSAQQCASLQALLEYREAQARNADVPPFKILNNQTLIDIAAANPRSLDDLKAAGNLTQKQIDRHGYNLLNTLAQSAKSNPPSRPVTRKPSDAILARMDLLKNWRKETGRKLEVESDIILPREVMEAIAYRGPASQTELNEIMVNFPWRSQHFGEQILGTIQQLERT
jgi:ribonuclease D